MVPSRGKETSYDEEHWWRSQKKTEEAPKNKNLQEKRRKKEGGTFTHHPPPELEHTLDHGPLFKLYLFLKFSFVYAPVDRKHGQEKPRDSHHAV